MDVDSFDSVDSVDDGNTNGGPGTSCRESLRRIPTLPEVPVTPDFELTNEPSLLLLLPQAARSIKEDNMTSNIPILLFINIFSL